MENCNITRDMLIEILARLPVRSLIRFKCVCKFFYCLIKSDNQFKHKHYEISRARSDYVVFRREIGVWPWPMREEVFGLVYKETDCDEIGCVDLPMPSSILRDVKCADGVLSFVTYKTNVSGELTWSISIWNPSTREIKELPRIEPHDKSHPYYEAVGLGFSSNDMTGKVVMIWLPPDVYDYTIPTVMVCSQAGNLWAWRRLNLCLPIIRIMRNKDFYLKGKYYWHCEFSPQKHEYLLWFDFTDEVLGKIELPPRPPGKFENGVKIDSWNLVCVINETITLVSYSDAENHFEVWSMNEHNNIISWNKYASFDCGNAYWFPKSFWNSGRHLLVYCPKLDDDEGGGGHVHYLISLDLATQEKKIFISNIDWYCVVSNFPFVYSESLNFF